MQDAHCSEYSVVQDAQHAVYAQLRAAPENASSQLLA